MKYMIFGFILCCLMIAIVNAISQKIIYKVRSKKNNNKIKKIRDEAYDEVLKRCKEVSKQGEVIYLSTEDIGSIIDDMKK